MIDGIYNARMQGFFDTKESPDVTDSLLLVDSTDHAIKSVPLAALHGGVGLQGEPGKDGKDAYLPVPNLQIGVEVRTNERRNGKWVWKKLIDFGALPNAGFKRMAHGITGFEDIWVDFSNSMSTNSGIALSLTFRDYCYTYLDTDRANIYVSTNITNYSSCTKTHICVAFTKLSEIADNTIMALSQTRDYVKGDKGDIGLQGLPGRDGLDGMHGIQGMKGDKGDTGLQGVPGRDGLNGVQGIQGPRGEKGDKGDTGLQGVAGRDGLNGIQGVQGAQGVQGQKGDTPPLTDAVNSIAKDVAASAYAVKQAYDAAISANSNAMNAQSVADSAIGKANAAQAAADKAQADATKAIDSIVQAQSSSICKIELLPYRCNKLPFGWYFCNGDKYSLLSAIGKALDALSAEMKADWGIVKDTTSINVPKMFHSDGRGYFFRPVDGSARQVGNIELDAFQSHGHFSDFMRSASYNYDGYCAYTGWTTSSAPGGFQSSTALTTGRAGAETRSLNIGMTPAIYLGV